MLRGNSCDHLVVLCVTIVLFCRTGQGDLGTSVVHEGQFRLRSLYAPAHQEDEWKEHSNVYNPFREENRSRTYFLTIPSRVEVQPGEVRRVRRSVSREKHMWPVCRRLRDFKLITPEELTCPTRALDRARNSPVVRVAIVPPSQIISLQDACICKAIEYTSSCFKHFFGPNEKTVTSRMVRPDPQYCLDECKNRIKIGASGALRKMQAIPPHNCRWMQTNTNTGIVYEVGVIQASYDIMAGRFTSPFIVQGGCTYPGSDCQYDGGYTFLFLPNTPKSKDFAPSVVTSHHRLLNTGDPNYKLVTSPDFKTNYVVRESCHYILKNGRAVRAITGELIFNMSSKAECKSSTWDDTIPTVRMPNLLPEIKELTRDLHICLLTRQSIMNSAKLKITIEKRLFKVFDDLDKDSLIATQYLQAPDGFYRGSCVQKDFTDLKYHCPDIWYIWNERQRIGCYDARLGVAFESDCACYKGPPESLELMGMFLASNVSGSWVATPHFIPISEKIHKIQLVADGVRDLYRSLTAGSGVLVVDYEGPRDQEDGTKKQEASWEFPALNLNWDLFGKVFGGLLSTVLIGVVIYLIVKFGCLALTRRKYQRLNLYSDEQEVLYEPHFDRAIVRGKTKRSG
ncbi:TPA_asm: hypothetical protein [Metorhabdovirus 2]|nr:TPA_asm: hypothetical protein [Metorhabdovirus 2]